MLKHDELGRVGHSLKARLGRKLLAPLRFTADLAGCACSSGAQTRRGVQCTLGTTRVLPTLG
jgi:hypothetical protein